MSDDAGRTLLHFTASPVELLTAWGEPREMSGGGAGRGDEFELAAAEPLVALLSGGDPGSRGRWSILAPVGRHSPVESLAGVRALMPTVAQAAAVADPDAPPFTGGFIGFISYELGNILEPVAARCGARAASPTPWPDMQFHRCDAALVYDHHRRQWWAVGSTRERAALAVVATAAALAVPPTRSELFTLSALRSRTGRANFECDVARIVEYIRAGDIFQANLAHTLTGAFAGSPRHFFAALLKTAAPWYGAYLDVLPSASGASPCPRRVICSASPELFLAYDPHTRRVVTRPMKGTVPASAGASALRESEKDRAELNMIIDLMRNDIGRVSAPASVRVDDARAIELHGHGAGPASVYQGVATISGTLAPGLDIVDLLRATFPAGSITGAPKIRAMQVIRELEPADRGPYCGAIGFISDSGHAAFSVAIRTALLTSECSTSSATGPLRGTCEYSVGAGIVADSVPALEWQETLAKARIISGLASGGIE